MSRTGGSAATSGPPIDGFDRFSLVAVLVDDLQWADSGTLMLLHRLAEEIAQQPVLLVAARRPVPSG